MALPEDFNKIYGSTATGGLTPISDVNYAKGWEFVGSNPPTKNDFSYLQNLSDLKSQWLYSNKLQRTNPFGDIKSDGTVKTALENIGLEDISVAGVATGSMGETGYAIFPMMIGGTRKTLIMQWGVMTSLMSGGTVVINLPIAFPTMVMQAYATHDNVIQTARPTVYAIAPTSRTTITATAMSLHAGSVGAAVTRGSDSDLCYGRYLAIGY